jgi:hypothetical protein
MEFERYSEEPCNFSASRPKNLLEAKRENKMGKARRCKYKKIHTKATINFRHNHIAMLKNSDQTKVSNHHGKASILWKAFKERMGNSDNPSMQFNLGKIFDTNLDQDIMNSLEEPFSDKEIVEVVKNLPNEKSPARDGFSNEFIKNCWPIIGGDITTLIQLIIPKLVGR